MGGGREGTGMIRKVLEVSSDDQMDHKKFLFPREQLLRGLSCFIIDVQVQ